MDSRLLLQTTKELISFQTTADRPDQLRVCADYIARFFDGTGLTVERFEFEGVPSVVVTKGTKSPKIFLNGHFDVVSGTPDQFMPAVLEDRLYGRGALDMKSGDAVLMHLMRDVANTKHDVGLMLTGDEEVGGFSGVRKLLAQGYGCEAVVIPDGGEAVHKIISKEKGILRLRLFASGVRAHGSMLWNGSNAIERLVKEIPTVLGQFVSPDQYPDHHWVTTANLGKIAGGEAVNQVPDFAEAFFDVRFVEQDDPDAIVSAIRKLLPNEVELESEVLAPVVVVPLAHPLVDAFARAVGAHGRQAEYVLDPGASDGRFFAERGIPILISQPDGANLHASDEWVHIPSVELYYHVVKEYLDSVSV